jgi:hypothetical protein|tara:strand:+ start:147 stop:749 length:603 start_codon:yes stop_codon:yes gene_type:complete
MATYNITYTGGMATLQNVYFYENITSYIDTSLLSGKNLLFYIRGRETNFIRTIAADPTDSGDYNNPTFLNNDRYWTLLLKVLYPNATNISTYDTTNNLAKRMGSVVLPMGDIYDIDVYYTSENYINILNLANAIKIQGINIVLKASVDATFSYLETDNPVSYYTEYTNNDLIAESVGTKGYSSNNNRDSQYGTQNWQPNY